jgi:hypothetical protein
MSSYPSALSDACNIGLNIKLVKQYFFVVKSYIFDTFLASEYISLILFSFHFEYYKGPS